MEGLGLFGVLIIGGVCILAAFILVALIAFIMANRRGS